MIENLFNLKRKLCFLAPMADITDAAFRKLIKTNFLVDLVFTEMISARGIYEKDKKTLDIAKIYDWDIPIFAQLFGSSPYYISYAAKYLSENFNISGIDINAGCPVKKIIKNNSGAALLKDLNNLRSIIKSVRKSVKIPVSLKIRLGFNVSEFNAIEVAKIAKDEGIAFLTIHGRFATQMYKGKANWDLIYKIKQKVDIPIIGNGDLFTLEDILDKKGKYLKLDGYMIARGILKNLALTNECILNEKFNFTLDFKFKLIKEHLTYLLDLYSDKGFYKFKKFFAWYISGLYNSHYFKEKFFKLDDYKQGFKLIDEYFSFLKYKGFSI